MIWNSAFLSTGLYITFSLLASASFSEINGDMLTILTSPKVHFFTRFCAALFGILIIGCGIPIYCIIMKNTLYASKAASKSTAFFWGALFPYLISWTLYQGESLLDLLNYAGLVINGLVAFILPLFLTLHATHVHRRKYSGYTTISDKDPTIGSGSTKKSEYCFF